MNKMKNMLLFAGFASVMLTSWPAGAWFFAGARGVMVVRPPAVYVAPPPAVYVAPGAGAYYAAPPPCCGLCSP